MKPDWNDAPEWANWLAMDDDGEWYWFEDEPILVYGTYRPAINTKTLRCGKDAMAPIKEPRKK